MHVASLHRYPVKSTAPHDLRSAVVERAGLVGDRRWMVVDPDGAQITSRTDSRLLLVHAALAPDDALELSAPGMATLAVGRPEGDAREVTVWDAPALGVDAGDAAAAWFGEVLRREGVRLVHCPDPTWRAVGASDHTAYADAYPILLTSTASLARVNEWIAADERGSDADRVPVPMRRFRPNVVVSGSDRELAPFAEESWRRIVIGGVPMRVIGPCTRCALTTVDPDTLARGRQPLRALARHHRSGSATLFGVNLVPDGEGAIEVSSPVVVVE